MRLVMMVVFLAVAAQAEVVATIEKLQGDVRILKADSIQRQSAAAGDKLYRDDLVITYKDAMATLDLQNGSFVTLDSRTRLKITDAQTIAQESGTAFFDVKKQDADTIEVATNFATIGVKGTQFIISDTNSSKDVSLKEGLVDIQALEGEFELHRKVERELTPYEKYKLELQSEYNQYKAKLMEEFVEYKKQFVLQPNKKVSFDGNVVHENSVDEEDLNEFSRFENFYR